MADTEQVMVITVPCRYCEERGSVQVAKSEWDAYVSGAKAQFAFPGLSAGLREQIISGVHPACFDRMFEEHRDRHAEVDRVALLGRAPRSLAVRIVNTTRREGYGSIEEAWDRIGPDGILEWRNIGIGALSVISRAVAASRAPVGSRCRWCGRMFGRDIDAEDPGYHEYHCDENPENNS